MDLESPDWKQILADILADFGCQTGTLHRTTPDGGSLALLCQIGVPESLTGKISLIPFGKGIAGAAAERKEPVTLCNLQQDLGGVANPDARKTGVSGSLAVPILTSEPDHQVLGTLGIGTSAPHTFSEAEIQRLNAAAREIARLFQNKAARGG
jgi:signal transduction protein with GAF and PtsI domain